ncbi:MAG: protein SCO1/2 [Myxococcota bacterium]|jgi:protein SCO1/2
MIGALLALACSTDAQEWPIQGHVLGITEDHVVLDHEPIPGLMAAMVMNLEARSIPAGLSPGAQIEATLVIEGSHSQLTDIRVLSTGRALAPVVAVTPPLRLDEVLAPVSVTLASGGTTILGAGQDRPTVLAFLFTTCPLPEYCPLLASKLTLLQAEIEGEGRILAITLDPEVDSLAVLTAYGRQHGANPDTWQFARLEEPALSALLDRAGVVRFAGEVGIRHALRLLVLDAEGRLVRLETSNRWDVSEVAETLRRETLR